MSEERRHRRDRRRLMEGKALTRERRMMEYRFRLDPLAKAIARDTVERREEYQMSLRRQRNGL